MRNLIPPARRLRRWIFDGLALLSLILCVLTAALWVRSHWVLDAVGSVKFTSLDGREPFTDFSNQTVDWLPRAIKSGIVFRSACGELSIVRDLMRVSFIPTLPGSYWVHGPVHGYQASTRFGFAWEPHKDAGGNTFNKFVFPLWWLVAATSLLPMSWLVGRLQRQGGRRDIGSCAQCGYDLRATPDRCPECGAVPQGSV
jgi:hypothetical protein